VNFRKGRLDDESLPWPAIIRRAHAEGHQIASHTWSHANLSSATSHRLEEEMIKPEMALRNILGFFPTYMRPPYVECNTACLALMERLGYHVIYFDMNTRDWQYTTPETQETAKVITGEYLGRGREDGWLSILHDVHWQTVYNLTGWMFDEMVNGGWRGTTVGECLDDPVENWYRTP
jgi:peptidoglycan/xylan/chitin deacetylase (PgdA/CDA1 family)